MNKEKKKGLFDFLKKPKSGCCNMEIIEVGKDKKVNKGCCDFEIVPNDVKEDLHIQITYCAE